MITGLLSPAHIVLLLAVLLLLFGAKRLPEIGRSVGSGMREFKHSIGIDPVDQSAPPPAARMSDTVAPSPAVAQQNPVAHPVSGTQPPPGADSAALSPTDETGAANLPAA